MTTIRWRCRIFTESTRSPHSYILSLVSQFFPFISRFTGTLVSLCGCPFPVLLVQVLYFKYWLRRRTGCLVLALTRKELTETGFICGFTIICIYSLLLLLLADLLHMLVDMLHYYNIAVSLYTYSHCLATLLFFFFFIQ